VQLASGVEAERTGHLDHRPGGLFAALGVSLLALPARCRTSLRQPAQLLLATGAGLAVISTVVGLVGVVPPGQVVDHGTQRLVLTNMVSVGTALSALVLCAGLLLRTGAGETGAALRLVLDGLVIAAAFWFVGFVLLSQPTDVLGAATPDCPLVLLAAGSVAVVAGLTVAVAMHCESPRRCLAMLGCAASLLATSGLGAAAGLCRLGPGVVLVSAGLLPVGLLLMTHASRVITAAGPQKFDLVRRAAGYAYAPMLAMAFAAIYHLLVDGRFMMSGALGWIVAGFALVTRQYLALVDLRGSAARLAEREAHFCELAHTDSLTGLANRRGLLRAMDRAWTGDSCVLLCLDLDGFKYVNDMHGHDAGDAVLREVGARLTANLRTGDLAARFGGDEFAVLMWARPPVAQQAADRLRQVLAHPYPHPAGALPLSVSIGLAGCTSADNIEELLRNADLALRFAKQRGKNRVEQYDITYDQWLQRRNTLAHDLRDAAERGELHLAFQPVVSLPSMRPVGAEALLRWRHPRLDNVRPDEFIPLAEERGMIAKLGAWVLDEACRQLSLWLADGHDVWASVNVSPKELHAPEYVKQVVEALHGHRVPPQRLVLEITEHAVATDLDELIKRLRALRSTGVRIALDDFGAGYSSLGQLRSLPVDILKIDQSLVAEPVPAPGGNGRAGAPMVDVIMRLGHRLGLEVIAEGVSRQSELAAVVDAGCRFGQGQLFGWGVPAEHLEAMLEAAVPTGSCPARVRLGPRRLLAPEGRPEESPATTSAQDVGSVDSARGMRQS